MKTKAVVFDVDGTLLNTLEYVIRAFERVMTEHGEQPDRQRIMATIGPPLIDCYKELLPNHDVRVAVERHHALQATPEFMELIEEYAGLRDTLDSLKRQGIHTAIFTNRWRTGLDLLLDHLALHGKFEVIITPESVKKGKPDPEGLMIIAKRLNVLTSSLVMVGDTIADIGVGKNAGAVTVGITHGFGAKEVLQAAGADHLIDSLEELPAVLTKIG